MERSSHPRLRLVADAALVLALATAQVQATAQVDSPTAMPAAPTTSDASALLDLGRRIYREGIRVNGEPLVSAGSAQARLSGRDVACEKCHRRSGHGGSEGQYVIRPITGPALREDQNLPLRAPRVKALVGSRQRPSYNEESLARAIGAGIDASGKELDAVMPRYQLNAEDMKALTAYLFSLSAQASPGVDAQDIHFATVIQPGVAPEKRRAMIDVMQTFVRDKNANVRQEEQRREAGNMRMQRAYRKWVFHVWELSGASDTWDAQLQAFYRQQPVFALVGGMGRASWQPIHEFSERMEIPTVFPQVDQPVIGGVNNYTFYFSKGLALEAQVLARFMRDDARAAKIVQVYRRGDAGESAAAAFRSALKSDPAIEDIVLDGTADDAFWRRVAAAKPGAFVLWLGTADLDNAKALAGPIYLSFGLLDGKRADQVIKSGGDVRLVYPSDVAPRHDARLLRNKLWLHNKGIAITDEAVQVNAQFAMTVVSDVVGHIADSFSRDYFVERIEHVVAQTPMPSMYPNVSLGPGQRFASKGASIVQLLDTDKPSAKAISGWIVP